MEGDIETNPPVLQCPACGRIFTNEKTKSRHRFYCRSKISKGQQRPPKRSCLSCVRAKARCDFSAGKCTRCKSKGLSCEWPQRKGYLPNTKPTLEGQSGPKAGISGMPLIPSNLPAPIREAQHRSGNKSADRFEPDVSNNDFYPFANSPGLFGMPSPIGTAGSATDSASGPFHETRPDLEAIAKRLAIYGAPFSSSHLTETSGLLLPRHTQLMSTGNNLLAFQYRTYSDPVQRNSAATLARFLTCYPTMMLRRETFPSFIHPQCVPGDEINPPLLHPLAKCMEIARAFKDRTPENSEMVWMAIKVEQERLSKERTKYSIWELLATLQSLLIYVIMRLVEGEKDYTDFDALLLVSMNLICSQMTGAVGGLVLQEEVTGKELSWKDWLFAESRRRTLSLYRVVGMCMHLETAKPCRPLPGFLDAPLPAASSIWNASNAMIWKKEYEYSLKQRASGNVLAHGNLILMHAGAFKNNCEAVWDDWFAGIDGLGILVVIATSMIL
ncbi:hypothetical protein N431DRAFT_544662 [Stipitochalara longipes BDJ]|nr:hypothetical protein N431DRAFT_544662 [Stipitochalara longipes BDJ]